MKFKQTPVNGGSIKTQKWLVYIVGAVDACECKSVTKSDNANSLAIIGRSALTPLQTLTTLVWNVKLIESHALVFMITCTLSKLLILKLSVSFKPLQLKGYESLDALTLKFHIVEKAWKSTRPCYFTNCFLELGHPVVLPEESRGVKMCLGLGGLGPLSALLFGD